MFKRKDLDEKYTWDLTLIYKNHEEYRKDFERLKVLAEENIKYKGRLNNKKDILSSFKLSSEISKLIEKMEVYLYLRKEIDGKDIGALEDLAELENFLVDLSSKTAYESVEMSKLSDEFIDDMINDSAFNDYDLDLVHLKEDKKHILDETREIMMGKIASFSGFSDIFEKLDNIELKFEGITLDNGDKVELTNASYHMYSHDESQNVRKQANENIHKGYKNFNLTISENFINFLKYCNSTAEFRNYDGQLNKQLINSHISPQILDTLISEVNNNLTLFYEHVKTLKNVLNLDKFYNCDMYAPLKCKFNKKYTIEEAEEIVKQAVKPLGVQYSQVVEKLFNSRTIDVYPTENKGGGAFSTSCYDVLPFILLNYTGVYNDISTLAHELGHSMHSYLSSKNQCYNKSGYDIFVAEIASTVNELLLFCYMEKNAKTDEERKMYISNFLGTFYATVFRQTMFTEFEIWAHNSIKNNQVLTYEKLNSKYGELQKKYFGDDVILLENANIEWSRIPHFYRPFYVYKYATGLISACSIVLNIIERGDDYVENYYLKFLSSGSSLEPTDILKLADVDIFNKATYDKAFKFYETYIQKFKDLQ